MFAICIESSHQRGMGHLFRALNFAEFLDGKNSPYLVLVNNDKAACDILESRGIRFEVVDLTDLESDWETEAIRKYGIETWINDRLDTDKKHAKNIKKNNV
ncbi:glycosyl transferase, partial [bacterium]|nr:glycosyl transferase [bacterium]